MNAKQFARFDDEQLSRIADKAWKQAEEANATWLEIVEELGRRAFATRMTEENRKFWGGRGWTVKEEHIVPSGSLDLTLMNETGKDVQNDTGKGV